MRSGVNRRFDRFKAEAGTGLYITRRCFSLILYQTFYIYLVAKYFARSGFLFSFILFAYQFCSGNLLRRIYFLKHCFLGQSIQRKTSLRTLIHTLRSVSWHCIAHQTGHKSWRESLEFYFSCASMNNQRLHTIMY